MSVRITPTQAPTNPAGQANEVVITVDNQDEDGGNFQADVAVWFTHGELEPQDPSSPGMIYISDKPGESRIQWSNVQINKDGTNFGFISNCDSSLSYVCVATDLGANTSASQVLPMDCGGAAPGPSVT